MALLKTKTPAAEPFIVPPLTSHPDYAALIDKRTALIDRKAAVRSEKRELERQIMDTPAPALRRGVAELLDEAGDSTTHLRGRLSELAALDRDIDAALEVLRQRLLVARSVASTAIVKAVKPEYGRRVAEIARALEAVAVARAGYDELRDQFEREDISWGALVPVSLSFLGDHRDGQIPRFVREAKEAGYYA
jgi:hypothetical protein